MPRLLSISLLFLASGLSISCIIDDDDDNGANANTPECATYSDCDGDLICKDQKCVAPIYPKLAAWAEDGAT